MEYEKIGIWIRGYLDALKDGEGITKEQLQHLIKRLNELIEQIEENEITTNFEEETDLPF